MAGTALMVVEQPKDEYTLQLRSPYQDPRPGILLTLALLLAALEHQLQQ
ncbi:hypothetical protein pEaSNUABM11_00004 [Erwinia phage pEa_SNUABM_11]|nr:hypothetical protein pEaSNUABM11_00004 [Erwinia phage pEa_SNUABM_11]